MSAATLSVRWSDCDWDQVPPVVPDSHNVFSRIGVEPRERHCPTCSSIVYCARHRLCGLCGDALPEDCLFTATEAENVEALLQTERQRHRAWLRKCSTT